jgi:4-hydroxybenzoate polyprenyltransferase
MNSTKTAKNLTITAYVILVACVAIFLSIASMPWVYFIAWPVIVIGFLAWAILLTIADKYSGADKKAVYKRNQIIFLVLFVLIIAITAFSTILK